MTKKTNVTTTLDEPMRKRVEAFRADQYAKRGRIPSMSEATCELIQQGLQVAIATDASAPDADA